MRREQLIWRINKSLERTLFAQRRIVLSLILFALKYGSIVSYGKDWNYIVSRKVNLTLQELRKFGVKCNYVGNLEIGCCFEARYICCLDDAMIVFGEKYIREFGVSKFVMLTIITQQKVDDICGKIDNGDNHV